MRGLPAVTVPGGMRGPAGGAGARQEPVGAGGMDGALERRVSPRLTCVWVHDSLDTFVCRTQIQRVERRQRTREIQVKPCG